MLRFVKTCLLLVLFLLPLLFATPSLGYEQIKFLFFFILISFIGLLWLFWIIWKQIKIVLDRVDYVSLAFLLVLIITSLFGLDPATSLIGRPPYFQGILLYSYLFLFSLIVKTTKITLYEVSLVLSGSSLIVALLSIYQAFQLYIVHQAIPSYAGRVVSSFGQPNLYGGFLIICLPFIFNNRFGKILFPIITAGVMLSFSRAAVLLLMGFLVFRLVNFLKWPKFKIGLLLLTIFGVVFLISINLSSGLIQDEIVAPQTNLWLKYNSPEKRILIWPIIGEFIAQKPILGYGLENLDSLFVSYQKEHEQRSPAYYGIKNIHIDRSHNYFLDLLVFSGIFGLGSWLILVYFLVKQVRGALLGSLLIYLVWSLLQTQSVVHLVIFWLVVGMRKNGA